MRSYDSLASIPDTAFERGTSVAVGKFDGVHRGHQALLGHARAAADRRGFEAIVVTFMENPQRVLNPDSRLAPIMSRQQRLDALAVAGISACVMLPFDDELAKMSAEHFVEDVLVRRLRARHVSVGPDFRFGHGGKGDVEMLSQLGRQHGFDVDVIGIVEDNGIGRVSSSRVREAIVQGDVMTAARMLGRPVEVRGTVIQGDARGRELGFPTANIGGPLEGLSPAEGVYAGWAIVGGSRHHAAISIGNNPTFTPHAAPRIEAFLLDFSKDIYGEPITIQFAERLRGNVVFADTDALVQRMHEDIRRTRVILSGR